jgi:two-component system chemotaxis sensor kinase CheA
VSEEKLSAEDVQLIRDFVGEATDNLASIETNLVALEEFPDDRGIIDSIFRPFHTIKGVSGFLNLKKSNRLAHSTENLLDSIRQGEFRVNSEVTDIVLASVDRLRQLIDVVEESLSSSSPDLESGVEVEKLIQEIAAVGERSASAAVAPLEEIFSEARTGQESPETVHKRKKSAKSPELQVKVDTEKLDNLIAQVGELVIIQSMLRQNPLIQNINDQGLFKNLSQLGQTCSSIQKTTMAMRMVHIRNTFQKMVRLVRDLAKNSEKKVQLEMSGEETEIDRNVVEELYEPLVHMVRNAVDHGLETPAERLEAGKGESGRIKLQAYHKGGHIIVEISDDGRGMDPERILEKAKSKGLVSEDLVLSEAEIYNLIFEPGFSTAENVTDVSGRGVGLDVVKRGLEKLRGKLDITSYPGQGSTFVISLPLTLAIIDGIVVRVGSERYVVPTMTICRSLRPSRDDCCTVKKQGEAILEKGNLIPLLRLNRLFGLNGKKAEPWESLVLIVEHQGRKRGLVLDELLGKEEVVIKSLGAALQGIRGLAGGAILGDGRVGLILDMEGLFSMAAAEHQG